MREEIVADLHGSLPQTLPFLLLFQPMYCGVDFVSCWSRYHFRQLTVHLRPAHRGTIVGAANQKRQTRCSIVSELARKTSPHAMLAFVGIESHWHEDKIGLIPQPGNQGPGSDKSLGQDIMPF